MSLELDGSNSALTFWSESFLNNDTEDYTSHAENLSTDEELDSFYFYEAEQFTVLWLLFVFIVVGNGGVLITLISPKSRKNRMNYFITHLAVADLLVGLINVLTDIIWRMTVSWNAGNIMCKIIKYLEVLVTYASTYVLVALSIDRYDAIRHPMKFSTSWKRAKALIFTAWFLSSCFSLPMVFFYEEKSIEGKLQCWIDFSSKWHWRLYMTAVAFSLFFIPAVIIAVCYAIIIITIRSKSPISITRKNHAYHSEKNNENDSNSSRRISSRGLIPRAKVKTVKITLVIVSAFIICWSPYIIFDLLQVYEHIPKTQTNIAIATFVQSLAPLNSAANPLIYCLFSTDLLKAMWNCAILGNCTCCGKRKKRENMASQSSNTKTSSLSEFITHSTGTSRSKTKLRGVWMASLEKEETLATNL